MATLLVTLLILLVIVPEVLSYESLCTPEEIHEMRVCANRTLSMVRDIITTCYDKNGCADNDFSMDFSKIQIADEHLKSMLNKTIQCREEIMSNYVLNDTNTCIKNQNLSYSLSPDEVENYEHLGTFMVGTVVKFPTVKSKECKAADQCVKQQISSVRSFYAECAKNFSMTSKCVWNQTMQLFCDCFDESDDKYGQRYRSIFTACLGSENEKFAKSILTLYEKYRSSSKANGWCQSFEAALKSDDDQTESVEKMLRNAKITKDDMKFLGGKIADLWGKISMRKDNN